MLFQDSKKNNKGLVFQLKLLNFIKKSGRICLNSSVWSLSKNCGLFGLNFLAVLQKKESRCTWYLIERNIILSSVLRFSDLDAFLDCAWVDLAICYFRCHCSEVEKKDYNHSSCAMADNDVYVFCGYDGNSNSIDLPLTIEKLGSLACLTGHADLAILDVFEWCSPLWLPPFWTLKLFISMLICLRFRFQALVALGWLTFVRT